MEIKCNFMLLRSLGFLLKQSRPIKKIQIFSLINSSDALAVNLTDFIIIDAYF